MQKKSLVVLALAGMLAAESVTAFAAPSIGTGPVILDVIPGGGGGGGGSSSGGGGGGGGSSSGGGGGGGSTRTINRTSAAQEPGTEGPNASGIPGAVVILDANTPLAAAPATATANPEEVKMAAGTQTNEKGETIVGNVAVGFVQGENALAGLPQVVVGLMNNINSGQPLDQALNTTSLAGYNALTGTHVISVTDTATGAAVTGNIQVSLYVPNLVDGLANVSILFYDNATGNWILIPVSAVDVANKTVTVSVPGSGVLSVVYQRQAAAAGTQAAASTTAAQ